MKVDVSVRIVIRRPCAEVAAYAMDPDNAPAWYVNIKSVEWKTPRPAAVGSQLAFVAEFLGRRLCYIHEFVVFSPGEHLVMRTSEGPFPMETSYEFVALGDGDTEMILRNRGAPAGFAGMVAPLMAMAVRRATRKDLAQLKRILEARSG